MASPSPSSSSSSSSWKKLYDVFISFRGEDTRNNFTGHLYSAFSRKKIKAYIDEESLSKGDEISPALKKGIQQSKISVVVLSENYASSTWCLDELNHILGCKVMDDQIVVPVFYNVDPSHVRKQQGPYGIAFSDHEQRCMAFSHHPQRFTDEMNKVQKWRNTLTTVSNLAGWDSSAIRSDSALIEAILKDILEKLNCIASWDNFKNLIGIEKKFDKIESLLNIGSLDVRVVGIWGIGGIGKTTIARLLFNRFACQFEGYCFLENIKEASKRSGLANLRKQFFSELLGEESLMMVNEFVKDRLVRTKLLIVLDDVDSAEQLEYLAGDHGWFGPGSKIIVTSRDAQVLNNIGAHEIYKVEELTYVESLQLFCSKAFRGNSLPTDYVVLSRRVLNYAHGVPLALKVLGHHLFSKATMVWESALDKLKEAPNAEIHKVLRISYDGLERNEKEIFLDIACFFKDEEKEFAERILDACDLHVKIGIEILIDKSLITLQEDRISAHDLVQEMGREIVREESKEPGKRSRLWFAKDIYGVLKYNTGTGAIQGMSLKMIELSNDIYLDPRVFNKMCNLKFLQFFHQNGCVNKLYLPQGLHSLPDELRYLRWDYYPLKSLPLRFTPQNLVELHLENSQLDNLPNEIQHFDILQVLNLSGCRNLDKFPELPKTIRQLYMKETAIENVPQSIEYLSNLKIFDLTMCKRLKSLATGICELKLLQRLDLFGCSELEYLPEILEPMVHLTVLTLAASGIRELPSSIENLTGIIVLDCARCENLEFVPNNIYNMRLETISFHCCAKLESLPPLSSTGLLLLTLLDLSYTSISEIPDWLFSLRVLRELHLCGTNISRVPESITFSLLRDLYVRDCKFLQFLPELPFSINLVDARGCTSLEMVSNSRLAFFVFFRRRFGIWDQGLGIAGDPFVTFLFYDCKKLNCKNMLTEFQIRALCNAVNFKERDNDNAVTICFPGNKVPNWFDYKNEGCSVNIKLPPNWYDTIFMVFCFCYVLAFKKNGTSVGNILDDDSWFELECEMCVKTNSGVRSLRKFPWHLNSSGEKKVLDLNHVFMVTHSYVNNKLDISSATEISFDFRVIDSVEIQVERCGVRMVYLQDAVDFATTHSSLLGKSNKAQRSRSKYH